MALNRILIMGRLTKDSELRRSQSGTAVTTFCLAVERDFKDKQTGNREVDFINCVAYKNTAEMIARYFTKGTLAVVDGRLQIRKYTDKQGNNRYATEVIVSNIYFGESKKAQPGTPDSPGDVAWEEITDSDGALPFN